jgi:signal transduction histidine kinase
MLSKTQDATQGSGTGVGFSARPGSLLQRLQFERARLVLRYLVGLVLVALATILRVGMDPVLGEHHPFTLYFAAVAITAWYGGFAPAILATILSYFAADWFFISPRLQFNWPHDNLDEFLALLAFLFSCLAIAFTSKLMREALSRARQKQKELQLEVVERQRAEAALRQAQVQLREYADLLEFRVEERTANLRETIRSLEGVCYHIAHDLRAPLRAMEGFTTILSREYVNNLDSTGLSHLQNISEAARRMDLLIHGLLEYGRLGHADFSIQVIEPRLVVDRVLALLAHEISSKRAQIDVGQSWPRVFGSQALLEISLLHLLGNALKFARAGVPPRIRIWTEPAQSGTPAFAPASGQYRVGQERTELAKPSVPDGLHSEPSVLNRFVRFSIEDNGIGIPPEHLSRTFWIFERLNPRSEYPGTGIGLAITSKAVERMNGRVGVESKLNQGSRFWFELPAPSPDSHEKHPALPSAAQHDFIHHLTA